MGAELSIIFKCTVLHSIRHLLHSISLFCTDLGLIDMLLTNQNAEVVACILYVWVTYGFEFNLELICSRRFGEYNFSFLKNSPVQINFKMNKENRMITY